MAKDYYNILGISKTATKEEIKKAYKQLAKKYHPDLNKEAGASDKFKEINEAAAVLGDDEKRQFYDQHGTADFGQQGFSGFNTSGEDFSEMFSGSGFESFDFGDIFDQLFGGSRRKRGPSRGQDLQYEIEITLEEAYSGATKTIVIPKLETCTNCKGTGARNQSDVKTCPTCNGTGQIRMVQRTIFGNMSTVRTCSKCKGEGKVVKEFCEYCDGAGRVEKNKKIEVKVPAGISSESNLRLSGEGEAGAKNGQAGDLYIIVHVLEHDEFTRKGNDLYNSLDISFTQSVLGDDVDVSTIDGAGAKLTIPAFTQPGTVFKMKGKGMPSLNGYGSGDQFVKVNIEVPQKLTKKQRELVEELHKELGFDQKKRKGFFG